MELVARATSIESVSNTVERWPWSVIEFGETSLDLVACKILMARGGIEIKPVESDYPDKFICVYANKNNWRLLDKLRKVNEYSVLQQAMYGVSELGVVGVSTKWNDETKRKVLSLFWQRRAGVLSVLKNQRLINRPDFKDRTRYWEYQIGIDELEAGIIGAKGMSLKILGTNPPLLSDDITGLVQDMITSVETKLALRI